MTLASSQECSLYGGRMPKDEWKLCLDLEKYEAVFPPQKISTIVRTIGDGPNLQALEHCHFASTFEELRRRAPLFHIRMPTCNKGEQREWPVGEVGQHMKIVLPIAITESVRSNDNTFDRLDGYVIFPNETDLSDFRFLVNKISVKPYSVSRRSGGVSMSRELCLKIIDAWGRHLFETS